MKKTSKSRGLRREVLIPFIAVLVAAVTVILWGLFSHEDLEKEARGLLQAELNGDIDRLYDAEMPQEQQAAHVTRDGFREVWRQLIGPRLNEFKSAGPIESELDSGEGVASVPLIDSAGHRWELAVSVWETDGGGKSLILSNLVTMWHLDAIRQGKTSESELKEAVRKGVLHDRAILEQAGIRGLIKMDDVHGVFVLVTWDQIAGTASDSSQTR